MAKYTPRTAKNVRESTAQSKRKVRAQRREIVIIGAILLVIAVCVGIYTLTLKSSADENSAEVARLEELIEEEKERTARLEDQGLFMQTREFIEKIARERLGLVMPGETVIKPEK